jgi:hypothetical protein
MPAGIRNTKRRTNEEDTMANSKISNANVITNNGKRISSLKKYVTNSKTEIPIGGERFKPADLIAVFQESLDTRAAVTATQGAYKKALVAKEDAEGKRAEIDDALKVWVLAWFGADSVEAHEFGYAARKKAVMTADERAAAVAANLATRVARGTKGPKQRLKIKGAPVASTAPAAPASNAAAAVPAPAPHAVTPTPAVNAPAAGGNA